MASFVLKTLPLMPDGTTVGAYLAGGQASSSTGPLGSPVQEQVASNGQVTFTDLVGGERYIAFGLVSGLWRRIGFQIDKPEQISHSEAWTFTEPVTVGAPTAPTHAAQAGVGGVLSGQLPNPVFATAQQATALTASTSVGGTTITVRNARSFGFVAIDVGTVNCEVRHINSVSGSTLTLNTGLTNAHSSGATVVYWGGNSVPASWFGATGDNSTDDIVALQNAVRQLAKLASNWPVSLTGEDRAFRISQPLLLPNFSSLERMDILAKSNYAPDDTNGAMVMTHRGSIQTFTALASNDTFTTPVAHGMTVGGGSRVVCKGPNLPGGVTSGQVLFIKSVPTPTTFTASTSSGGATLNLTSDGSGDCYPDPQAEVRLFLRQVTIDGQDLGSNIGGLLCDLQQPSRTDDLRINNCTGHGLKLYSGTQQGVFVNTEIIHCGNGLTLSSASFCYFFGLDIEQSISRHIYVQTAFCCLFHGFHMESAGSTPTVVDLEGDHDQLVWENVEYTVGAQSGKGWWQHTGNVELTGYTIRNLRAVGSGSTGHKLIVDDDRGLNLDVWDDFRFMLDSIIFPRTPSSSTFTTPNRWVFYSSNGGFFKIGGRYGAPRLALQNDSDNNVQPVLKINDRSGNDASGMNWDGVLYTKRTTAPADADLVAGQLAFWLDATNGAVKAKFKAKSLNGTAVSGEVALT